MRNADVKLMKMHERAAELKRRRDKSCIRILGSVSSGLTVCLVIILQRTQSLHHEITGVRNTGASMLSGSVGGYVLVALIAFFTGVILTVILIRSRKRE